MLLLLLLLLSLLLLYHHHYIRALQAEKVAGSFPDGVTGFFIDLILPAAFWPWDRLSL